MSNFDVVAGSDERQFAADHGRSGGCRDEVLYYRTEAGARVAKKLVDAMKKALQALEQQPGMGSPAIGQELDIDGLHAWRLEGFPLSLWYFERADHVLVVRLVGQRQDAEACAVVDD